MNKYFDIEYRKKCRKSLVYSIYDYIINTNYPPHICGFVIKACHFTIPYIFILITMLAPVTIGIILTILSMITFGMFLYLKGCFVSHLEYKLDNTNFINIMDPYLVILGWDINEVNRYNLTLYLLSLYFILMFTILYLRWYK
mgnify:FL=1|jgi:hypothetical protein